MIIIAVCLLSISACSSRLIYNNLDWLTYWYLDDYVSLTNVQEKNFDPALIQFLDWHRKSELETYVKQVKRIQYDINNGMNRTDIENHLNAFTGFWRAILIAIEPGLVKLATSLTDKQIADFLLVLEQRNLDEIKEQLDASAQARVDERFKKIQKRITSYTGKLTTEQTQLIRHANTQVISTFDEWITYRRAWARAIEDAYQLRSDKLVFEQTISQLIVQADNLRTEKFIGDIEYNQQLWVATLTQLIRSLNEKQLKKLNAKLQDIIEDIEALI